MKPSIEVSLVKRDFMPLPRALEASVTRSMFMRVKATPEVLGIPSCCTVPAEH